jgi:hypothetical protein
MKFKTQHIIFLLLGATMLLLLIWAPRMNYTVEDSTRKTMAIIDDLPPGSLVLVGADFDVENKAELRPQMEVILRQLLAKEKGLRIISISMWDQGPMIMDSLLRQIGEKQGRTYGTDYVNLGYAPGVQTMIRLISSDFGGAFSRDFSSTPLAELPIMENAGGILNTALIVEFSDRESGPITYIEQVKTQKPEMKIVAGLTAASFPPLEPYLHSGQLNGAVVGLKGAAEYEQLLNSPGLGMKGMDTQSVGQVLIMVLIIVGNIIGLVVKGRRQASRGEQG